MLLKVLCLLSKFLSVNIALHMNHQFDRFMNKTLFNKQF